MKCASEFDCELYKQHCYLPISCWQSFDMFNAVQWEEVRTWVIGCSVEENNVLCVLKIVPFNSCLFRGCCWKHRGVSNMLYLYFELWPDGKIDWTFKKLYIICTALLPTMYDIPVYVSNTDITDSTFWLGKSRTVYSVCFELWKYNTNIYLFSHCTFQLQNDLIEVLDFFQHWL